MKKSDYMITSVLVAILLFLTLQKGWGGVVLTLLPFFLIYAIYNLVRIIRRPAERKRRGIRLAIWSITFVLAVSVQSYWNAQTQQNADLALSKVLAFKARAGTYPPSLTEVGLDEQRLKDAWGIRYSMKQNSPTLVYPASFMPLTMFEYDFQNHKWRQNSY